MNEKIDHIIIKARDAAFLSMLEWYLDIPPGNEREWLITKMQTEVPTEKEAFIDLFTPKEKEINIDDIPF